MAFTLLIFSGGMPLFEDGFSSAETFSETGSSMAVNPATEPMPRSFMAFRRFKPDWPDFERLVLLFIFPNRFLRMKQTDLDGLTGVRESPSVLPVTPLE